jgi:transcriptional regulator NrdR family protein
MYCEDCGNKTKVIDSRNILENGTVVYRRRECSFCQVRFNTFEERQKKNKKSITKD